MLTTQLHWKSVGDLWYAMVGNHNYILEYDGKQVRTQDFSLYEDLEAIRNDWGSHSFWYEDPIERAIEIVQA